MMAPVRYFPAGKRIVPPPTSAQAAMVLAIAAVLFVLPSGTPPSSRRLKTPGRGPATRAEVRASNAMGRANKCEVFMGDGRNQTF
jgi:hypothetical protein